MNPASQTHPAAGISTLVFPAATKKHSSAGSLPAGPAFRTSSAFKVLVAVTFFAFFAVVIFQTNPLWTRLVLGRFSAAQHLVLVAGCLLAAGIAVAQGFNRLLLWAGVASLPIAATAVGCFYVGPAEKLQLLASCVDLLRLPAAALFGATFTLTPWKWPKVCLVAYVLLICSCNAVICGIENAGNRYFFEIPGELTTTTDNALDKTLGMEGEIRPRSACISPNGLASVLSFGFLAAIGSMALQPHRGGRNYFLFSLSLGLLGGIYFSTVRSAFGPAVLALGLLLLSRAPFCTLLVRQVLFLAVLALALTATAAIPSLASLAETQLRPYLGKLASSSSSLERNGNWGNIQADISRRPEIAFIGIDVQGIPITERKHQSGICDNQYYYSIYHWGALGFLLIAYFAIFPFTPLFGDPVYGVPLWLSAIFMIIAAAFTDEIYYLPTAFFAFVAGLGLTDRSLRGATLTQAPAFAS